MMAHENEILNKRVRFAEDELKVLSDRLFQLTEELEQKSKIIKDFSLRDNSNSAQPARAVSLNLPNAKRSWFM